MGTFKMTSKDYAYPMDFRKDLRWHKERFRKETENMRGLKKYSYLLKARWENRHYQAKAEAAAELMWEMYENIMMTIMFILMKALLISYTIYFCCGVINAI